MGRGVGVKEPFTERKREVAIPEKWLALSSASLPTAILGGRFFLKLQDKQTWHTL